MAACNVACTARTAHQPEIIRTKSDHKTADGTHGNDAVQFTVLFRSTLTDTALKWRTPVPSPRFLSCRACLQPAGCPGHPDMGKRGSYAVPLWPWRERRMIRMLQTAAAGQYVQCLQPAPSAGTSDRILVKPGCAMQPDTSNRCECWCAGQSAVCAIADWRTARRWRPHCAVQLSVCSWARRQTDSPVGLRMCCRAVLVNPYPQIAG